MGRLLGQHERSTIGASIWQASGLVAARVTLTADPDGMAPLKFLIVADQGVCLRQGGPTVVAVTALGAGDFVLPAGMTMWITVESVNDAYVSVIIPFGGVAGNVCFTQNNSPVP